MICCKSILAIIIAIIAITITVILLAYRQHWLPWHGRATFFTVSCGPLAS